MKKLLIIILLLSANYSYAQTINAEQIKKDNVTIRGNPAHQLRADTSFLTTKHYVDSIVGSSSFDTTNLSNRIDLKIDSVRRIIGTDTVIEYYDNGTQRFAFIDSVSASTIAASAWALTGNVGTNPAVNFVGTIDPVDLAFRTENILFWKLKTVGQWWGGAGYDTIRFGVTGIPILTRNTAMGDSSMAALPYSSVDTLTAHSNTAYGSYTLKKLVNGVSMTAIGTGALENANGVYPGGFFGGTVPYENTAIGAWCMNQLTTGNENTAVGAAAMYNTTTGTDNVAMGLSALQANTTGSGNDAFGVNAGLLNLTGNNNSFFGHQAGQNNTVSFNTFIGNEAGFASTTGGSNTAVGAAAMGGNIPGNSNTAIGSLALTQISGAHNIGLGFRAGANSVGISNEGFIDAYGFGQRTSRTDDTTGSTFWFTTNGTNLTQRVKLNATVAINDGTNTVAGKRFYLVNTSGSGAWSNPEINTTAGDGATIDKVSGRFRKDTSGATFTLTNAFITANSIIHLTQADAALDATATRWTVSAGAGTATVAFDAAPTANFNMNFTVEN